MLTVLIVEDNIIQLTAIETILKNNFNDIRVLKAADYSTALSFIQTEQIQLFLLDIELDIYNPQADGIELGQYIRTLKSHEFTPILFITSIPDKISDALNKVHCYNYILKPYSAEDLIHSINTLIGSPFITEQPLRLKDLNGIHFNVNIEDILHVTTSKKTLIITTTLTNYKTRDLSLEQLLKKLPNIFIQCHRSHIINLSKVTQYDKTLRFIALNNNTSTSIPVGKIYKKILEEKLQENV